MRVRPRRRSVAGWLLAMLLGASTLLFAACAGPRNELGLTDGSCYVALPTALTAVQGGTLLGVRLVNVHSLEQSAPVVYAAATASGRSTGQVCLVAFAGHFEADHVARPRGRSSGRLAVAVVAYPGNRLLATVIAPRLPLHFGHSHLAA